MRWALRILVVSGALWGATADAASPKLFSYEASYSVQLARGSFSTGPRAANGFLNVRFHEKCEGWDTRSRIVLDLTFRDDTTSTNERDFESFEAKDGHSYTFAARTVKGSVPVEAFRGAAEFKRGGVGKVEYEIPSEVPGGAPRKLTISLPRGTLLPVAHALELLSHAEKGDRQFRSVMFNGASSVGPRLMSTVIGPQIVPMESELPQQADIDAALLMVPAWDLNLAYYNLIDANRETPSFEVFQRFYASGVAPSFEQAFGDFTIRAELEKLQRIKPEECAKN
jgi:hypothetical protein